MKLVACTLLSWAVLLFIIWQAYEVQAALLRVSEVLGRLP